MVVLVMLNKLVKKIRLRILMNEAKIFLMWAKLWNTR